jgi:hypothetical protein
MLLFATDFHGSETCFKKFLNAGKLFKVKVLVLGGDITGKSMIPLVEQPDGSFKATYLGLERNVKGQELEDLEALIRKTGSYPYRTTQKELDEMAGNKSKLDSVFAELMRDRLKAWLALAAERLANSGIKMYLTGGNDDPLEFEDVLKSFKSDCVYDPEGEVVDIDGKHEMISCGYTNSTPWKLPRDISEEELKERIDRVASNVKDLGNCIFNLHCPPFNSGLDMAPALDENLEPKVDPMRGGVKFIPVGSTSVRKAIEKYQPLVSLHGHIHESRGIRKIGRTVCINPGSEYGESVLKGVVLTFRDAKLASYVLTEN